MFRFRFAQCLLRYFLAAVTGSLIMAAAAAADPEVPAIPQGNWRAPQRISWRLRATPMWFSVGHVSRVMCFVPRGFIEDNGKLTPTRDGSGHVIALDIEVHEVSAFQPGTVIPAETTLIERFTVKPDTPGAEKQRRWPFPSEQGSDFELSALPQLDQQTLYRMYLHGTERFVWHTLMIHAQAKVQKLPAAVAEAAGTAFGFADILVYTIVCERLNDPSFSYESKYIEANDPPIKTWIRHERVPAPWVLGKAKLEPANGTLTAEADGTLNFSPLSEQAKEAAIRLAKEAEAALGRPQLPTEGADLFRPETRMKDEPEF